MTGRRSQPSATILATGAGGQVGREIAWAFEGSTFRLTSMARGELDITSQVDVQRVLSELSPALVINAAAYTAVDRAEAEPEQAFAVNRDGAANLAQSCARSGIPLIHISTDYVFDGAKPDAYLEDDPIAPLNVYGNSKAAGESEVRRILPCHIILRTSWVYGAHGGNFVKTMLRLGQDRDNLRVVDDQRGAPTAAADVAAALAVVARALLLEGRGLYGTYHFADRGETTWFGFAQAIFDLAAEVGRPRPRLTPVSSAEFPTPAKRPANSVLDTSRFTRSFRMVPPAWKDSLARTLPQILTNMPKTQPQEKGTVTP